MSKALKFKPDSQAGVELEDDRVSMSAGEAASVIVGQEGVYINGPISLNSMPEDIRIGGLWVMQMGWMGMIPSTLVTPFAQYTVSPPVSILSRVARDVAWAASIMAAVS